VVPRIGVDLEVGNHPKKPCPHCGEEVEARVVESTGEYPNAMVLRVEQFKKGPEHETGCKLYSPTSWSG
jgi:hypothetical protein